MKGEFDIFDDGGYPTDEFLQSIKDWDWQKGFNELLEHAMQGHIYKHFWDRGKEIDGKTEWRISTGGWSGNEDIIWALEENIMFWAMCWVQSRRGGHFVFECQNTRKK